jgi:hypothetical protein
VDESADAGASGGGDKGDAWAKAVDELDSGPGPAFFTDFFKGLLHSESVVEIPLLGGLLDASAGFGDISASAAICRPVRFHSLVN